MNTLAAEEDYDTLKKYLAEYEAQMPVGLTDYCRINSVNALLNYYGQWAEQNGIKLSWKIQLPDDAGISQPDLCSVLGNVVENALFSSTLPLFHLFCSHIPITLASNSSNKLSG